MFKVFFPWGEVLETENWSWRQLSKMVKWYLQTREEPCCALVTTASKKPIRIFVNWIY